MTTRKFLASRVFSCVGMFGQMAADESLTRQRVPPLDSRDASIEAPRSREKKIIHSLSGQPRSRILGQKHGCNGRTHTPTDRRRRAFVSSTNGGRALFPAAASCDARAHEGVDHGRRSHGKERVDARGTNERDRFFYARIRMQSNARARTTAGREGETTHRWRNDPRGTGTRAGVTSRGTFATTTTGKRTAMREWRRERVRGEFLSSFPRRDARFRTSESGVDGVDGGGVHARGAGPQPLARSYRYAGGWGLASTKDYGICLVVWFVCLVFIERDGEL